MDDAVKVAHYSTKHHIEHSLKTGDQIPALCGERFVAKHTDLPVCPNCREILNKATLTTTAEATR